MAKLVYLLTITIILYSSAVMSDIDLLKMKLGFYLNTNISEEVYKEIAPCSVHSKEEDCIALNQLCKNREVEILSVKSSEAKKKKVQRLIYAEIAKDPLFSKISNGIKVLGCRQFCKKPDDSRYQAAKYCPQSTEDIAYPKYKKCLELLSKYTNDNEEFQNAKKQANVMIEDLETHYKSLLADRFKENLEVKKSLECIIDNIVVMEPGDEVLKLKNKGLIDYSLAASIVEYEDGQLNDKVNPTCLNINSRPVIKLGFPILSSPEKLRFTLAHEIAHLIGPSLDVPI